MADAAGVNAPAAPITELNIGPNGNLIATRQQFQTNLQRIAPSRMHLPQDIRDKIQSRRLPTQYRTESKRPYHKLGNLLQRKRIDIVTPLHQRLFDASTFNLQDQHRSTWTKKIAALVVVDRGELSMDMAWMLLCEDFAKAGCVNDPTMLSYHKHVEAIKSKQGESMNTLTNDKVRQVLVFTLLDPEFTLPDGPDFLVAKHSLSTVDERIAYFNVILDKYPLLDIFIWEYLAGALHLEFLYGRGSYEDALRSRMRAGLRGRIVIWLELMFCAKHNTSTGMHEENDADIYRNWLVQNIKATPYRPSVMSWDVPFMDWPVTFVVDAIERKHPWTNWNLAFDLEDEPTYIPATARPINSQSGPHRTNNTHLATPHQNNASSMHDSLQQFPSAIVHQNHHPQRSQPAVGAPNCYQQQFPVESGTPYYYPQQFQAGGPAFYYSPLQSSGGGSPFHYHPQQFQTVSSFPGYYYQQQHHAPIQYGFPQPLQNNHNQLVPQMQVYGQYGLPIQQQMSNNPLGSQAEALNPPAAQHVIRDPHAYFANLSRRNQNQ